MGSGVLGPGKAGRRATKAFDEPGECAGRHDWKLGETLQRVSCLMGGGEFGREAGADEKAAGRWRVLQQEQTSEAGIHPFNQQALEKHSESMEVAEQRRINDERI